MCPNPDHKRQLGGKSSRLVHLTIMKHRAADSSVPLSNFLCWSAWVREAAQCFSTVHCTQHSRLWVSWIESRARRNERKRERWSGGDGGDRACVHVHELIHHSRRNPGAPLGAGSDHGKPAHVSVYWNQRARRARRGEFLVFSTRVRETCFRSARNTKYFFVNPSLVLQFDLRIVPPKEETLREWPLPCVGLQARLLLVLFAFAFPRARK